MAHRLAELLAAHRQVERFDLFDLPVLERDAEEGLAVLARDDEPALVVLGHGDPRTFGRPVGGVEQFGLEARRQGQRVGRQGVAFGDGRFLGRVLAAHAHGEKAQEEQRKQRQTESSHGESLGEWSWCGEGG